MASQGELEADGSLRLGQGQWLVLCPGGHVVAGELEAGQPPPTGEGGLFLLVRDGAAGERRPPRLSLLGGAAPLRLTAAVGWEATAGPAVALLEADGLDLGAELAGPLLAEWEGGARVELELPPSWVGGAGGGARVAPG